MKVGRIGIALLAILPCCAQTVTATFHFYRFHEFGAKAIHPSVYCDEGELARIQNGRVFTVEVPVGRHFIRADSKYDGGEVNVKGPGDYYFRLHPVIDGLRAHWGLTPVGKFRAVKEIESLKPLDEKWVREARCGTEAPLAPVVGGH